jgi:hypothetical protein
VPLARIGGVTLFFAHVPKTGGTSVEAYLRAKGAVVALHGQAADWSRAPVQHLPREAYAKIVPRAFYDHGFAVLRDPMARLMSEFRMRVEPLEGKFRPLGRLRARGPVHGVRLAGRLEALDFDGWVARAFEACRRDPWAQSCHLRPQADFVDEGQRLFLFEDGLDPVFRWIDAVTGTPAAAGAFHERRSAPLPLAPSPATEERVRRFYAADHALIARLREGRA